MIVKLSKKLLAIPFILGISIAWLIMKTVNSIYGICYGLLAFGVVSALILFLIYQEWRNVIAVLIIAAIAFVILIAGSFIQVLLEEMNQKLFNIVIK